MSLQCRFKDKRGTDRKDHEMMELNPAASHLDKLSYIHIRCPVVMLSCSCA